jgi:hypothetical protein
MYGCVSKGGTPLGTMGGAVGPIALREAREGRGSGRKVKSVRCVRAAGRAKSSKLCQRDGASRPYDSSGTHGTWHMGQNYLLFVWVTRGVACTCSRDPLSRSGTCSNLFGTFCGEDTTAGHDDVVATR